MEVPTFLVTKKLLKTTIQKFEKPMGDALNFHIEFDLESYLRCTINGLV